MKRIAQTILVIVALGGGAAAEQTAQRSCLVEPSKSVDVAIAASGVLAEIRVDRGDKVKRGQLLARLDSSLENELLSQAKMREAYTLRELDRNKELLETNLLSEKEADELTTEHQLARTESAAKKFEIARRAARSPINGVVVEKLASEGEFVKEKPLLRLVSIDPLYAEVVLGVTEFGKVRPGMSAVVRLNAPIDADATGKVTLVDPIIDPQSSTFRVRIEIPNKDQEMPSGATCRVMSFGGSE